MVSMQRNMRSAVLLGQGSSYVRCISPGLTSDHAVCDNGAENTMSFGGMTKYHCMTHLFRDRQPIPAMSS